MPDYELIAAFAPLWMATRKHLLVHGRMGKVNPDGTVSLETGRPNEVYVRVGPEGNLATSVALNLGVPLKAHLPVLMWNEDGVLIILSSDYLGGLASFSNGATSSYNVARHTHALGSGLEYAVEAMRLTPGRVQWLTALTVTIFPFRYYYGGAWETWEGGTLDLTALKPAAGKWCWVLIGLDPATNLGVAVKGADQNTQGALTVGLIDAIDFAHYIPCAAVQLAESDTVISGISRYVDAHGWLNGGRRAYRGDDVLINILQTPTRDDLEDYIDSTGSKGVITGGAVTDAGGATVDVTAGEGFIRAADNDITTLFLFEWAAATGVTIPSNTERFVVVDYNGGTPVVALATTLTDPETRIFLARIYNEAGTLHLSNIHEHAHSGIHWTQHMLEEVFSIRRADRLGGILLGETGTRKITVSAGELYLGLNEHEIDAINTNTGDTFDAYYRNGSGGWTKVAAQTDWPNTQYDNGSGTLQTLTNNRWGTLWFYVELDGELTMLYGTSNATSQANAETESAPGSIPPRLLDHAVLAGRFIFQKSAATAAAIQSAFSVAFTASAAGASTLDELTDVTITTPADNEVLAYDSGSAAWINQVPALDDLSDVAITSPSAGHILRRDGTNWKNGFNNRPNLGARVNVTIATGVIDISGSPNSGFFNVRGEGAAADDLDTLNGGNAGDLIVITGANETITVKDSTGNINCASDRTLNSGADVMMLLYDGSSWNEVVHTSNA